MKRKILIVEDEQPIATLLAFNIEKNGYIVDVANDGLEAIHKAETELYDLMILDLMLPKMDGIEVCKYLRKKDIYTPILMLTARNDVVDKVLGLEIGADDYLTKPFSPKEVIARIRAILRRVHQTKENAIKEVKIGQLVIYPEKYEAKIYGQSLAFTKKEFELLYYLARHKGIVLSREQLLKGVWNYDFVGDTRIVDVHISRLREKIEDDTKEPQYITTIRGLGYKLEDPTT